MLLYQYATLRILRLREKYMGPSSEKLDVFAWVADGAGSRPLFEAKGRPPESRLEFLGVMEHSFQSADRWAASRATSIPTAP